MGKKLVTLIDPIDYDYKYLEYKKEGETHYLDGNNFKKKCLSLEKITYTSEEIIHIDSQLEKIADKITEAFKETFINRGREATEEQIYFANETAKIVLGESIDNKIIIDPAPCGYGKSTIKLELMRYFCFLYSKGIKTDGAIIAGDRLEDLRQLQEDLGEYSQYTYLIEGWNENICKDKTKKTVETGMCRKCSFYDCKIKKQMFDHKKYPIILVANARLKEFGDNFYNTYKDYDNGKRKILLIDEKPQIIDNVEVSNDLLNKIDTACKSKVNAKEVIDLIESAKTNTEPIYITMNSKDGFYVNDTFAIEKFEYNIIRRGDYKFSLGLKQWRNYNLTITTTSYTVGWNQDTTGWYYYTDTNGNYYKDSWQLIDNEYYSFDPQGYARQSVWIQDGGVYYYLKDNCMMARNETLTINGTSYTFDSSGAME